MSERDTLTIAKKLELFGSTTNTLPNQTPFEALQTLTSSSPDTTKAARLGAVLNIAQEVVPGIKLMAPKILFSPQQFPVRETEQLPFVRSGENILFRVEVEGKDGQRKPYVLKVNQESLDQPYDKQMEIARRVRADYERIHGMYQTLPDFTIPEHVIMFNSQIFGKPVIGVLQPFVHGDKKGLFEDYEPNELHRELQKNLPLRKQVAEFARQTLDSYVQTGECIDFLGDRNVLVVRNGVPPYLLLIDPHGIFTREKVTQIHPRLVPLFDERISYLEEIRDRLKNS